MLKLPGFSSPQISHVVNFLQLSKVYTSQDPEALYCNTLSQSCYIFKHNIHTFL